MKSNSQFQHTQHVFSGCAMAVAFVAALALPGLAFAQDGTGAATKVTSFFSNLNNLLYIASIAVVTIAVIFAGYQIAFNHKRISDVAPVLIGGFLIGAASQIARMVLPDDVTAIGGATGGDGMALMMAVDVLQKLYA